MEQHHRRVLTAQSGQEEHEERAASAEKEFQVDRGRQPHQEERDGNEQAGTDIQIQGEHPKVYRV
jgi:hypothetical protein